MKNKMTFKAWILLIPVFMFIVLNLPALIMCFMLYALGVYPTPQWKTSTLEKILLAILSSVVSILIYSGIAFIKNIMF